MFHLHCDVDNTWVYESEFAASVKFDPSRIYEQSLPDLMDLFEQFGARATFFIIGKDLALDSCKQFCMEAISRGHAIGNHTFSHLEHFFELSYDEKKEEIVSCEQALAAVINQPITSFRSPGYYLDRDVMNILLERGYKYDSSVLPGVTNQIMRPFISSRSGHKLNKKFGRAFYAIAPEKITKIVSRRDTSKSILEVPIATCPIVRTPVHSSIVFLAGIEYFRIAAKLMSSFQRDSIILFHGIDALHYPMDMPLASKLPSLMLPLEKRLSLLSQMLTTMSTKGFVSTDSRLSEAIEDFQESRLLSWTLQ